ncbi:hypothetical protein N7478_009763 [Penicillium angulare]|uniref:uncharacterized protein n=1 Tax=Penicillium angulare TaxID=116970 RepID=UPI002540DF1A|nr:uncharacterized protein N7478_009763 [Penicillium angulare]KAJ5266955.1 hypothetical protein N7478_009763 [Penicillium angulare]
MRSFITAAILITGVAAQSVDEYLKCAEAALDGVDTSSLSDCSDKSSKECLCANPDAITKLTDAASDACGDAGIDVSELQKSLCSDSSVAAPARHASNPMEPANMNALHMSGERAYAPPVAAEAAAPRVIYVTETKTECGCKATPAPAFDPKHLSHIPVNVPTSSSMGPMASMSAPPMYSKGILVGGSSSSRVFGAQMSATPTPSGASANRFNAFEGAAPKVSAIHGFAVAGVAAVMGFMVAL